MATMGYITRASHTRSSPRSSTSDAASGTHRPSHPSLNHPPCARYATTSPSPRTSPHLSTSPQVLEFLSIDDRPFIRDDEPPAQAAHPLPPTPTASLGLQLPAKRDTRRERACGTGAGARVSRVLTMTLPIALSPLASSASPLSMGADLFSFFSRRTPSNGVASSSELPV